MTTALDRLAAELGQQVERRGDGSVLIVSGRGHRCEQRSEIDALTFLAYAARWRDDREELRARIGFEGPVSEVADGLRADALRWLVGQGPAVERLARREIGSR